MSAADVLYVLGLGETEKLILIILLDVIRVAVCFTLHLVLLPCPVVYSYFR